MHSSSNNKAKQKTAVLARTHNYLKRRPGTGKLKKHQISSRGCGRGRGSCHCHCWHAWQQYGISVNPFWPCSAAASAAAAAVLGHCQISACLCCPLPLLTLPSSLNLSQLHRVWGPPPPARANCSSINNSSSSSSQQDFALLVSVSPVNSSASSSNSSVSVFVQFCVPFTYISH